MPISVTPSDQVVINTDEAEEGDLLRITMDDRSSFLLTLHLSPGYNDTIHRELMVEPRLYPSPLRQHIKQTLQQIFKYPDYAIEELYRKRDDANASVYDLVYKEITERIYVQSYEVGQIPVFSISASGLMRNIRYKPLSYPTPVIKIEPAKEWDAQLFAARLQAEM